MGKGASKELLSGENLKGGLGADSIKVLWAKEADSGKA